MRSVELRLASWNIHMGVGRDGRRDMVRIAQVIRQIEPDIIGLQEVDNHNRSAVDDLLLLREETGLEAIAGPTMQKTSGDYGNALLTRLPVLEVERHDISFKQREPRGVLIVHLDWGGKRIQVAVTHFGLRPGERRFQVRRLMECLDSDNRQPLILMGDFNEWLFFGRPLRWLRDHFGHFRSPPCYPARFPLLRLDHIMADPRERLQQPAAFRSPSAKTASDHLPLTALFKRY